MVVRQRKPTCSGISESPRRLCIKWWLHWKIAALSSAHQGNPGRFGFGLCASNCRTWSEIGSLDLIQAWVRRQNGPIIDRRPVHVGDDHPFAPNHRLARLIQLTGGLVDHVLVLGEGYKLAVGADDLDRIGRRVGHIELGYSALTFSPSNLVPSAPTTRTIVPQPPPSCTTLSSSAFQPAFRETATLWAGLL